MRGVPLLPHVGCKMYFRRLLGLWQDCVSEVFHPSKKITIVDEQKANA